MLKSDLKSSIIMDNYQDMYKTICRLCLSRNSTDKMVSLIDNSTDDGLSCFGKAITTLTNVLLRKNDKLPSMMCHKCYYLLKQTIYFKLRCESTDKQLKNLVNIDETSYQNIEEIVCQYVMYNQYFPVKSNTKPSTKTVDPKNGVKRGNFPNKSEQNTIVQKVEIDINMVGEQEDSDDYMDDQDNISNCNDKQDEYSNEINNILDSIQDIINTESNFNLKQHTNHKIKRRLIYRARPANERNLTCTICNKVLANRITYDHHMQRHNRCRYICDQCGKGFPILTEMHMHQVARHGIGPYLQCDHCPYKAPRKLNLIEHLRLHTGERPFTCEKCGLTFRRRAIWRNHLICHMEKKLQCKHCPKKFYRQGALLAHCNNVHERMYMYMCNICSVTYTKTETVKRHMLVKHGIPREKQGKIVRVMRSCTEYPGKGYLNENNIN